MIVDDLHDPNSQTRGQTRADLDEKLLRPLNPAQATARDEEQWAQMNADAMHQHGMGAENDPHLAQPVSR